MPQGRIILKWSLFSYADNACLVFQKKDIEKHLTAIGLLTID